MVRIDIAYEGRLRCRAVHGPSGTEIRTDAPTDNMGRGESFSPTDLVATALGTCMMTVMGIAAERHGIALDGATVRVGKEMITGPTRRIGQLTVDITVPGEISAEDRRRLKAAAMTCPVHRSLHPDVRTPVTFRWGPRAEVDAVETAHV